MTYQPGDKIRPTDLSDEDFAKVIEANTQAHRRTLAGWWTDTRQRVKDLEAQLETMRADLARTRQERDRAKAQVAAVARKTRRAA